MKTKYLFVTVIFALVLSLSFAAAVQYGASVNAGANADNDNASANTQVSAGSEDDTEENESESNAQAGLSIAGIQARARTQVELNEGNDSEIRARLSNGKNAQIKIMPEVASETAIARLRLHVCSEENNCTIELKEVPVRNETRVAYEVQAQKQARILGLFRARMNVQAQVDAETGALISTKKPWWAFLASETNASAESETEVQA